MYRRGLLRHSAAAALLAPTAGCLTAVTSDTSKSETTSQPTGGSPPRLLDTDFSLTSLGCGEGVDEASVTFEDGTVHVEGTISTPTDCHVAHLNESRYDPETDTLSLRIHSRSHTAQECRDCRFGFGFEAACTFTDGVPATTVVYHNDAAIARAQQPPSGEGSSVPSSWSPSRRQVARSYRPRDVSRGR
jgi:hypothetical protein